MMMKTRNRGNEAPESSHTPAKRQFEPRAFATPGSEHESLVQEAHFDHSFSEIGLFPIQPKLVVGSPNDKYEQEADRVAEQVMRMPEPRLKCQPEKEDLQTKPIGNQITPLAQREEADPEEMGEDVGPVERNEISGNEGNRTAPRRVAASARAQAADALDRALERLTVAIEAVAIEGSMPNDVHCALERFFPGESPDFLPLLQRRIAAVRSIIETVRIRYVFTHLDESVDPDAYLINHILLRGSPPSQALPLVSPNYILVIPPFYNEQNLQATRIIHECFHIYYDFIRHAGGRAAGYENPRANAYSYQGFVSMLGGLDQVRPLELFPERGAECEVESSQQPNVEEEQVIQTKEVPGHPTEVSPNLQARINAMHGDGRSLSRSERTFFEPRFGYDFSQVRVHTDAKAAELARAVSARAFTTGQDIFLRQGEYRPESSEGQKLLAHELTHVVQQGKSNSLLKSELKIQKNPATDPLDTDPCVAQYNSPGNRTTEIHLNLSTNKARVYTKTSNGYNSTQFENLITGPVTVSMASSSDLKWCHMHPITAKIPGPTPRHGLLYFVVFCSGKEIGFHSDHQRLNGNLQRIPGSQSHGCVRIPHVHAREFYNLVGISDCVRIYSRANWRAPTFANCSASSHCQ